MYKLAIAAVTMLGLTTPAMASQPHQPPLMVPCQQNTDDGRILFSNGMELPKLAPGQYWNIRSYRVTRQDNQLWTSGECTIDVSNHPQTPTGHSPTADEAVRAGEMIQRQSRERNRPADQFEFRNGEMFIETGTGQQIICEVVGVSSRTLFDPQWKQAMLVANDVRNSYGPVTTGPKPVHAYCMNAFNFRQHVPVNPDWIGHPFLQGGAYVNKPGFTCFYDTATAANNWAITCDWSPYDRAN